MSFMNGDKNQGKSGCKITSAGWMWPGITSHARHAQTCQGEFGWSEDGMANMEVIQNEKLIEFFSKKWVFVTDYIKFQMIK